MIQMITGDKRLQKYLHHDIEDAGIAIGVDSKLQKTEYIGIKVDDYYAGLHLATPPKAVDFIVTVDCECSWYTLYILELKGVKNTVSTKDIQEKFDTTINRFMAEEFKDIFSNDSFKYRDIKLYLVTTSYKKAAGCGNFEEYIKLRTKISAKDSLTNDSTLSLKPYFFRGRVCRIEREFPPNPLICKVLKSKGET